MSVTHEYVRKLFEYREDGALIRKIAVSGKFGGVGQEVGCYPKKATRNNRYAKTKVHGEHWCLHKLIYFWHYGVVPAQLDHLNRNTLDNRIENLRPASGDQNACNKGTYTSNTSGAKNLYFRKKSGKWEVVVKVNKKAVYIGAFADKELAELVALEAREKHHGAYACHQ